MNDSDKTLLTLGGTPKWWAVNDERLLKEVVLISDHNVQFSSHCSGGEGEEYQGKGGGGCIAIFNETQVNSITEKHCALS